MIEVRELHKQFGEIKAVNGVTFSIESGVCIGMLGKNGAGKTTTVEMMEGIKKPDSGTILYKGEPPGERFKNDAGIMFQSTALQDFITVKEILKMFSRFYSQSLEQPELIDLCNLEDILNQNAKMLSGGQKQRLLLAIALINDPQVLFLDEPTTGLDPNARRNVWKIINNLKSTGKTIVLTTHYMEEAYELCDRIMIMDKGKIIAQGTPSGLLREHFDDSVIELPANDIPVETIIPGITMHKDLAYLYSKDVNADVETLLKNNVSIANLRIRSRNLEDLFLEITGENKLT